jgi:hypothetical protein
VLLDQRVLTLDTESFQAVQLLLDAPPVFGNICILNFKRPALTPPAEKLPTLVLSKWLSMIL